MKTILVMAAKFAASTLLMLGCFVLAILFSNFVDEGPMEVREDLIRGFHWGLLVAIIGGGLVTFIDNRKQLK